jgi:hypothetical protein
MIKVWRRNWTSQVRRYSNADLIVVSIPKSGRTWLRVFLHAYFCALEKREFTLRSRDLFTGNVPKFIFTHDLYGYLTALRLKDRISGRHLIPPPPSRQKRILLLSRDPRDVIVSLFFHFTKRVKRYRGDMHDMIHDPRFGIMRVVDIMNTWLAEWGGRRDFKVIRYEDCQRRPEEVFRELLNFLGCREIDDAALARGMEVSSFENMRAMEAAGKVKYNSFRPGNVDDPDSYKVRRGRVGGFTEYVKASDVPYLEQALARLDKRFGYESRDGLSRHAG